MKILIFGMSCVGKTTVGQLLAEKLHFKFVDLDEINIKNYETINDFLDAFPEDQERAEKQGDTIKKVMDENDDNIVFAITPINSIIVVNNLIKDERVLPFELQDNMENIFDRLFFTDDNDVLMEDSEEYKLAHKAYYKNEVNKDIEYYNYVNRKIPNKIFINGRTAEEIAELIYKRVKKRNKDKVISRA